MKELARRANLVHCTVESCDLLLYEDHRTLLNVLYHARRSERLARQPLLVYFDHHDDATRSSCDPDRLRACLEAAYRRPHSRPFNAFC